LTQDATFEIIAADEASEHYLKINDTTIREFHRRMPLGCLALAGRDAMVTQKYKRWMQEAGFRDVVDRPILAP
jgi:hypothetical protein